MPTDVWRRILAPLCFTIIAASPALAATPQFNGQITRPQLEHYLSRAVTMEGLLAEHGNLDDEIRFLKIIGARFAGRVIYSWGGEATLDAALVAARDREAKIHKALPDLMLQAAIFEIVSGGVEEHSVPDWVLKEFDQPAATRKFSYDAMLFPDGKFKNNWGKGKSVPDIRQIETQMWFYYLAARYMELGVEAIHFGQVDLMGLRDKEHTAWDSLLTRVRKYAQEHARRKIVLCDAHVPRGAIRAGDRLLLDFHSFPLRIEEVADKPVEGVLKKGYLDSIYGRSKGGVAPSGWECEHLPFLVELDNFGRSRKEGRNIGGAWIWGYDEITWFAHLSRDQRDRWLRYAAGWIRENDPNGYLEMPGSRTIAVKVDDKDWYWASNPSPNCPTGFGDEATIREIWKAAEKRDGKMK